MIIKLHGTSGSGKSTLANMLLEAGACTDLPLMGRRPEGYRVDIATLKKPLFVLGPYETACGGLDALGNADDHIALLLKYGPQGHVFYEGLLQSGFYGRIGKASEQFGDDHVFAFLDTPLQTCLDRIVERRKEKGNTKPFNPENTVDKFDAINKLKLKLGREYKRPVIVIDYTRAFDEIMLLYEKDDAKP